MGRGEGIRNRYAPKVDFTLSSWNKIHINNLRTLPPLPFQKNPQKIPRTPHPEEMFLIRTCLYAPSLSAQVFEDVYCSVFIFKLIGCIVG